MKMKNIMKSRKTTDSTRRKGRDAQADPDEDYLDQDYDDYDNEEEERIRRIKNKGLVRVSYLMVALFLSMAGYLIYFNVVLRDDINNNQYNTKQSAYQEQIIRGNIYSADGNVLAQTDIAEDGTCLHPGSDPGRKAGYQSTGGQPCADTEHTAAAGML